MNDIQRQYRLQTKQLTALAKRFSHLFELGRGMGDTKVLFWADSHQCSAVDPFSDLDAVYQMEEVLTAAQQDRYVDILYDLIGVEVYMVNPSWQTMAWVMTHSTAAQRVEAILKTLSLWKD